jgi:hypothetical protein
MQPVEQINLLQILNSPPLISSYPSAQSHAPALQSSPVAHSSHVTPPSPQASGVLPRWQVTPSQQPSQTVVHSPFSWQERQTGQLDSVQPQVPSARQTCPNWPQVSPC